VSILVSVIVAVLNEEKYIGRCLESLLQQTLAGNFEVLVIDGGSTDRTVKLVQDIAQRDSRVRLINNPKRIQVVAFNMGIQEALGEYIAIVGAHADYDPQYLANCLDLIRSSGASNVGGVQTPVGNGILGTAIAWAMSSPFGVGGAQFRYAKTEIESDSVFGGFFPRQTLLNLGGFNERYKVNEDYELNYRLRQSGGKVIVSPKIRCQYYVRSSLKGLMRQMFRYGFWRVQTQREHPKSFLLRHLVPPILAVLLCLSAIAWLLWPSWFTGSVALIYIFYTLLGALAAFRSTKDWKVVGIVPLVLMVMQLSWGVGWWFGVRHFGLPSITRALSFKNAN